MILMACWVVGMLAKPAVKAYNSEVLYGHVGGWRVGRIWELPPAGQQKQHPEICISNKHFENTMDLMKDSQARRDWQARTWKDIHKYHQWGL